MERLGAVQQKVSCVFDIVVLDEQSGKRENQPYKVVASNVIKQRALDSDVHVAVATEKLDGTCVYFSEFQDRAWLLARFDRKPSKGAEKRFRKFQYQQRTAAQNGDGPSNTASFKWDAAKDFKETPETWVPASGVKLVAGCPVPDDIGHTPGWVPVLMTSRPHVWHLSAVDLTAGMALVLREVEDGSSLYIDCEPLDRLQGQTAELIGTNINGNPYGLGSKKFPIHVLVVHGSIKIRNPPHIQSDAIKDWLRENGQVEGIVWHCADGTLFKLHRNHVALPWPVASPNLTQKPVRISMETMPSDLDTDNTLISQLLKVKGHTCDSLKDLEKVLSDKLSDEDSEKDSQDN